MTSKPVFYIDTNICRDVMKMRNTNSVALFEKIRENNWECYTLIFTFMEITDVHQDDIFVTKKIREGWEYGTIFRSKFSKELTNDELSEPLEKLKNFFIQNKFIKPVILTEEGWKLAFYISSRSTISSPDSIHLAAAWQSNCHLLVTNDNDFIKQSTSLLKKEQVWTKLRVCKPENVISTMKGIK